MAFPLVLFLFIIQQVLEQLNLSDAPWCQAIEYIWTHRLDILDLNEGTGLDLGSLSIKGYFQDHVGIVALLKRKAFLKIK